MAGRSARPIHDVFARAEHLDDVATIGNPADRLPRARRNPPAPRHPRFAGSGRRRVAARATMRSHRSGVPTTRRMDGKPCASRNREARRWPPPSSSRSAASRGSAFGVGSLSASPSKMAAPRGFRTRARRAGVARVEPLRDRPAGSAARRCPGTAAAAGGSGPRPRATRRRRCTRASRGCGHARRRRRARRASRRARRSNSMTIASRSSLGVERCQVGGQASPAASERSPPACRPRSCSARVADRSASLWHGGIDVGDRDHHLHAPSAATRPPTADRDRASRRCRSSTTTATADRAAARLSVVCGAVASAAACSSAAAREDRLEAARRAWRRRQDRADAHVGNGRSTS